MLITIQICFYMNSYQDFISSLSTDKSYVDACYFLDKTDSVKKQTALSERYHDDCKNIYFLMTPRNVGIYFHIVVCFEKTQKKVISGYVAETMLRTHPPPRPDPPAHPHPPTHPGGQLFPGFLVLSQVPDSEQ